MKQIYEKKKVYNVCGTLEKDENGRWVIIVENKDNVETYNLDGLLSDMNGTIISLKSVEFV